MANDDQQRHPTWREWEQHTTTYTSAKGEKSASPTQLVEQIATPMKSHSGHIFRIAHQHSMESFHWKHS